MSSRKSSHICCILGVQVPSDRTYSFQLLFNIFEPDFVKVEHGSILLALALNQAFGI